MGQRVTCMGALHPHKYPQDATTLDFVPSQRNKRRIVDRLSSSVARSLERLRSYAQFYRFTHTPPQTSFPIYQPQICKFSRKLKESSWLMSDTAFRYMAASNVSMAWGKVNEQLYNDILRLCPTAAAPLPRLSPSYSGLLSLLVPPQLPPQIPSPTPMAPLPLPPTFHHAPSIPNKQPSVVTSTVGPAAAQTDNLSTSATNQISDRGNYPGFQCPKVPQP